MFCLGLWVVSFTDFVYNSFLLQFNKLICILCFNQCDLYYTWYVFLVSSTGVISRTRAIGVKAKIKDHLFYASTAEASKTIKNANTTSSTNRILCQYHKTTRRPGDWTDAHLKSYPSATISNTVSHQRHAAATYKLNQASLQPAVARRAAALSDLGLSTDRAPSPWRFFCLERTVWKQLWVGTSMGLAPRPRYVSYQKRRRRRRCSRASQTIQPRFWATSSV